MDKSTPKTKVLRLAAIIAGAALLAPALSQAHDYTYIEGGFVSVDNDYNDDDGFMIGGSFNLAPQFAVIGEYDDTGHFDQFSVGGLFHTPLNNAIDLTLGATLEHGDTGPADDTGFGLRGGIRWWALPGQLEVIPELRYVDLFNDDSLSFRATGLLRVAPQLDVEAYGQGGDDDRFGIGLRYNFGARRGA